MQVRPRKHVWKMQYAARYVSMIRIRLLHARGTYLLLLCISFSDGICRSSLIQRWSSRSVSLFYVKSLCKTVDWDPIIITPQWQRVYCCQRLHSSGAECANEHVHKYVSV